MINVVRFAILGIFVVALLVANNFAIERNLFISIWWLDIVFHAAGGALLAIAYTLFFPRAGLRSLIITIFIIGGVWEMLEFFIDSSFFGTGPVRVSDPLWALDTTKDLLVDCAAGLLAGWISSIYNKKHG